MAADGFVPDKACCGACALAVRVAQAGGALVNSNGHLRFDLGPGGVPLGAVLVLRQEGDAERVQPIDRAETVIGREAPAHVVVPNYTLSRRQCSFRFTAEGEVVVSDLQSTCGTFVNGESIGYGGGRALREGDVVYVADLTMEIRRGL